MRLRRIVPFLLLFSAAPQLFAQTWDTSGNKLLNGSYYFRQVLYLVGYQDGSLSEAVAVYGSINFNGTGTYSGRVSVFDSSVGSVVNQSINGTYSIAASGFGFIGNPLVAGDAVYGSVNAAGIFIASSTETQYGYNDMLVAAPLASPAPTVSNFKGTYTLAGMDLSSGTPSSTVDYQVQISPDGVKNLGTITGTGYAGQSGSSAYAQSISGSTYIASGGAMVVTVPQTTNGFLGGQKYLYISPDGNFVFGGSPQGWDMIVGVRTSTTSPSFGGLYYQAGLDQDESQLLSAGYGNLESYYGSFSAANQAVIGHQRLLSLFNNNTFDYTYADSYSALKNSAYATSAMSYVVGMGGVRIGTGIGPYLGINVALPAPSFSGSGVYLNPTGIVNAASSAPFTAGVAPGELLTLYGTGLADNAVVASSIPFPTSLGNVQVTINGVKAPIYYVAPTQISVIVPYATTQAIAQIQVTTDGNQSNTVTTFTGTTAAGVFSVPPGGLGYAAALHQNGSLVSEANPAQANETVSVFVTGLGAVTPTISDGNAGPVSPLSQTTNTITAYIGGTQATVTYSGLAPQLAGLYQVNVTVPAGLTAGDNNLDISGPDSYSSEVVIPVGSGSAANSEAVTAKSRRPMPRLSRTAGPRGVRPKQ